MLYNIVLYNSTVSVYRYICFRRKINSQSS